MNNLISNLESALNAVSEKRDFLERRLMISENMVVPASAEKFLRKPLTIEIGKLKSKLFLLGSISGELKKNIETYKDLLEKYNLIEP